MSQIDYDIMSSVTGINQFSNYDCFHMEIRIGKVRQFDLAYEQLSWAVLFFLPRFYPWLGIGKSESVAQIGQSATNSPAARPSPIAGCDSKFETVLQSVSSLFHSVSRSKSGNTQFRLIRILVPPATVCSTNSDVYHLLGISAPPHSDGLYSRRHCRNHKSVHSEKWTYWRFVIG